MRPAEAAAHLRRDGRCRARDDNDGEAVTERAHGREIRYQPPNRARAQAVRARLRWAMTDGLCARARDRCTVTFERHRLVEYEDDARRGRARARATPPLARALRWWAVPLEFPQPLGERFDERARRPRDAPRAPRRPRTCVDRDARPRSPRAHERPADARGKRLAPGAAPSARKLFESALERRVSSPVSILSRARRFNRRRCDELEALSPPRRPSAVMPTESKASRKPRSQRDRWVRAARGVVGA